MVWNYWMESAELAHKLLLKNLIRWCLWGRLLANPMSVSVRPFEPPAALTNYKNVLPQVCRRLQRREFALDVALELAGLPAAAKRALLRLPASDAPRDVIVDAEFGFTGKSKTVFSAHHPLCAKMRDSWALAVRGLFEFVTGSDEWPPVGAPDGMVEAALILNPDAVQLYRGLKISRPGVSNTTLQCSPSFYGRPRQDAVVLSGGPDFAYDDVRTMEFGLVHGFFSYSDPSLVDLLRWGAQTFGGDGEDVDRFAQFFVMQRYRPSPTGDVLLPTRYYAAKDLSNDFETEYVGVIHSRARPMSWFHGTAADDMKKRKGAIFCRFK